MKANCPQENLARGLAIVNRAVATRTTLPILSNILIETDEMETVTGVKLDAEYEDNGLYHKKVRVSFETKQGEQLEVTGEVKGFIPLRNRREGQVTHIGEGMTEWRLGDRVGYGLSEFLRQVE